MRPSPTRCARLGVAAAPPPGCSPRREQSRSSIRNAITCLCQSGCMRPRSAESRRQCACRLRRPFSYPPQGQGSDSRAVPGPPLVDPAASQTSPMRRGRRIVPLLPSVPAAGPVPQEQGSASDTQKLPHRPRPIFPSGTPRQGRASPPPGGETKAVWTLRT